jgi:hypothetical protein
MPIDPIPLWGGLCHLSLRFGGGCEALCEKRLRLMLALGTEKTASGALSC